MVLPQRNASELLALASVSDGEVMSRFLALPPVKSLSFGWTVTLIISFINRNYLKTEDNFGLLSPLYSLRDETSLYHKLKESHIRSFKYDDAEVETGIWYNTSVGVMGEEFSSERHGIIF